MEYKSPEGWILSYLATIEKTKTLYGAHLKCLKPLGNSFLTLKDIENRKKTDKKLLDITSWGNKDFEFDINKVKNLFLYWNLGTAEAFDNAVVSLRSQGFLKTNEFWITTNGVKKFDELKLQNDKKFENKVMGRNRYI